jgi:hypothetical protein
MLFRDSSDDDKCEICSEAVFAYCSSCGDALCESHTLSVPRFDPLRSCLDCLVRRGDACHMPEPDPIAEEPAAKEREAA